MAHRPDQPTVQSFPEEPSRTTGRGLAFGNEPVQRTQIHVAGTGSRISRRLQGMARHGGRERLASAGQARVSKYFRVIPYGSGQEELL
jgi:hypothetical protein